jgi:hypothetical protein
MAPFFWGARSPISGAAARLPASGDREIVQFWRFSSHLRPSEYFLRNFIKKLVFKL